MLVRYVQTIKEILALRRNGYSGPFFMGLIMLTCGVQLLLTHDTFSTSDSYTVMEEYATEEGWGMALTGLSLILIVSSLGRRPREVALGAVVSAFAWLVVFVSVFLGNPQGILMPIVGVFVLRCMSLFQEFRMQFDPVTGHPYAHPVNERVDP